MNKKRILSLQFKGVRTNFQGLKNMVPSHSLYEEYNENKGEIEQIVPIYQHRELHLPLVCISMASTSFLLRSSAVAIASLTYVATPRSI